MDLELPPGFPDKYREAVVRAMDQCKVKRQLEHPPTVTASVSSADPANLSSASS